MAEAASVKADDGIDVKALETLATQCEEGSKTHAASVTALADMKNRVRNKKKKSRGKGTLSDKGTSKPTAVGNDREILSLPATPPVSHVTDSEQSEVPAMTEVSGVSLRPEAGSLTHDKSDGNSRSESDSPSSSVPNLDTLDKPQENEPELDSGNGTASADTVLTPPTEIAPSGTDSIHAESMATAPSVDQQPAVKPKQPTNASGQENVARVSPTPETRSMPSKENPELDDTFVLYMQTRGTEKTDRLAEAKEIIKREIERRYVHDPELRDVLAGDLDPENFPNGDDKRGYIRIKKLIGGFTAERAHEYLHAKDLKVICSRIARVTKRLNELRKHPSKNRSEINALTKKSRELDELRAKANKTCEDFNARTAVQKQTIENLILQVRDSRSKACMDQIDGVMHGLTFGFERAMSIPDEERRKNALVQAAEEIPKFRLKPLVEFGAESEHAYAAERLLETIVDSVYKIVYGKDNYFDELKERDRLIDDLNDQLLEKDKLLSGNEASLQTYHSGETKFQEIINQKDDEIHGLAEKIQEKENVIEGLKSKCADMESLRKIAKENAEAMETDYLDRIKEKDDVIHEKENKIRDITTKKNEADLANDELSRKVKENEDKAAESEAKAEAMKGKCDALRKTIDELNEDLQESQYNVDLISGQMKDLRKEINDKNLEIMAANANLKIALHDNEGLRACADEVKKLREENEELSKSTKSCDGTRCISMEEHKEKMSKQKEQIGKANKQILTCTDNITMLSDHIAELNKFIEEELKDDDEDNSASNVDTDDEATAAKTYVRKDDHESRASIEAFVKDQNERLKNDKILEGSDDFLIVKGTINKSNKIANGIKNKQAKTVTLGTTEIMPVASAIVHPSETYVVDTAPAPGIDRELPSDTVVSSEIAALKGAHGGGDEDDVSDTVSLDDDEDLGDDLEFSGGSDSETTTDGESETESVIDASHIDPKAAYSSHGLKISMNENLDSECIFMFNKKYAFQPAQENRALEDIPKKDRIAAIGTIISAHAFAIDGMENSGIREAYLNGERQSIGDLVNFIADRKIQWDESRATKDKSKKTLWQKKYESDAYTFHLHPCFDHKKVVSDDISEFMEVVKNEKSAEKFDEDIDNGNAEGFEPGEREISLGWNYKVRKPGYTGIPDEKGFAPFKNYWEGIGDHAEEIKKIRPPLSSVGEIYLHRYNAKLAEFAEKQDQEDGMTDEEMEKFTNYIIRMACIMIVNVELIAALGEAEEKITALHDKYRKDGGNLPRPIRNTIEIYASYIKNFSNLEGPVRRRRSKRIEEIEEEERQKETEKADALASGMLEGDGNGKSFNLHGWPHDDEYYDDYHQDQSYYNYRGGYQQDQYHRGGYHQRRGNNYQNNSRSRGGRFNNNRGERAHAPVYAQPPQGSFFPPGGPPKFYATK